MAKSGERRLKVFQAQLGFFETVVAVPSQAAALRAWQVHQNLFTDGQARATDDPQAAEAALAHPGVPLKRALGSKSPLGKGHLEVMDARSRDIDANIIMAAETWMRVS